MECEEKFLDKGYLETRVRDLREIKRGDLDFSVEPSCNADKGSKSLYIHFRKGNLNLYDLRVSDHSINTRQTQFIVTEGEILTKKKRGQFTRLLEKAVKMARKDLLKVQLGKIGKENEC